MINLEITPPTLRHLYKQTHSGRYPIIVDIKRIGCSGWAYNIFPADRDIDLSNMDENDHYLEYIVDLDDGSEYNYRIMTVYVLERAGAVMDGATIDYVKDGLEKKIHVTNPNVKAHCGCGESFAL